MSTPKTSTRPQRLEEILQLLLDDEKSSAQSLAARFDVSVMTIHRDLDELQRRGMVRKFHGGVSVARTGNHEIAASLRRNIATENKQRLAECAAGLLHPGQSLFLDDSTTVAFMAQAIAGIEGLGISTNYLPLINTLAESGAAEVRAIGGAYNHSHESFLGLAAVRAVEELRVDVAFVSTSTADADGFYHQEEAIVELKMAMLRSARRSVLLMDSSKLGQSSMHRLGGWEHVDDLITDMQAPGDFLGQLKALGVRVHVAPNAPEGAAR
ncbi:DeoR/GlpR family DNA-binding transcription regulator [Glutamicibacter protophormiae]